LSTSVIHRDQPRSESKLIELSVMAAGTTRLAISDFAEIRRQSPFNFPVRLSPQLLRHSDEQTLAALAALADAINGIATNENFSSWAIISASQNLGQSAFAAVIDKYRSEGPWGVSVQVIPHCTAHAVAGTISLALGSHGPCIGAGSGREGDIEALLCTASLLQQANWNGAWLVLSAWSPALAVDKGGEPATDSSCIAAALAISRKSTSSSLGRVRIEIPHRCRLQQASVQQHEPENLGLLQFLCGERSYPSWSNSLKSATRVHIEFARIDSRLR
jgi:hypothetical protein